MAVYSQTKLDWLKNAMALAIVSSQHREDIVGARPEENRQPPALSLSLRLGRFGMSFGDVVRQCRTSGVLSRHQIHQIRPRGNSPAGSAIHIDRVSKAFSDAVKNIGRNWGDKNPPTFHEIRSLSERLYAEQATSTRRICGPQRPEDYPDLP